MIRNGRLYCVRIFKVFALFACIAFCAAKPTSASEVLWKGVTECNGMWVEISFVYDSLTSSITKFKAIHRCINGEREVVWSPAVRIKVKKNGSFHYESKYLYFVKGTIFPDNKASGELSRSFRNTDCSDGSSYSFCTSWTASPVTIFTTAASQDTGKIFAPTLPAPVTTTTKSPKSGEWTAFAPNLGEFVFTVDSSGTAINKITFRFSNLVCGPVLGMSGGVEIKTSTPWPITDGHFTISSSMRPFNKITISGKFDETGTHTTGIWKAEAEDVICSDRWESR